MPFEILRIVDEELSKPKFRSECTAAYTAMVRAFILDSVVRRLARFRQEHDMFEAEEMPNDWDEQMDLDMGASCMFPYIYTVDCSWKPGLQMLKNSLWIIRPG